MKVRFLGFTLGLWAVGVQMNELFAAIGAWGTALLVVIELIRSRQLPQWKAWWPLLLFLGWCLIAPPLLGSPPTGTGVARLSDWLLLPIAVRAASLATLGQKRMVAVAATLVMLASCAAAGLQHYGRWPPLEAFAGWGWTRLSFARVYEQIPDAPDRFMGGGFLFHRLKFANVTSLFVVMLFAHGLRVEGIERRLALFAAGCGLIAVASFPYARSATVALVGGLVVVVLFSVQRRSQAITAAAAIVLGAAIFIYAVPSLRARFEVATTAAGSGERPELVKAGLAAVRAHPIVGVGPGRFRPSMFAPPDAPPQVLEHPGKAHNQLVTFAAEAGIPGALAFVVLLVWVALKLNRARPESIGGLGVLAVFVLLCLTHDPLFHPEMSFATVLLLGLMLASSPKTAGAESSAAPSQSLR